MYINNNYTNSDKNKLSNILNYGDEGNNNSASEIIDIFQKTQKQSYTSTVAESNLSNQSPNLSKKMNLLQLSKLPSINDMEGSPPESPTSDHSGNRSGPPSIGSSSYSPRFTNKPLIPNSSISYSNSSNSSNRSSSSGGSRNSSPRSNTSSPHYPSPPTTQSISPMSSPHGFSAQVLVDFSQSLNNNTHSQNLQNYYQPPKTKITYNYTPQALPIQVIPPPPPPPPTTTTIQPSSQKPINNNPFFDSSNLLPPQSQTSPVNNNNNNNNNTNQKTQNNNNNYVQSIYHHPYEGVKSIKETYLFEQIPLLIACFHNNLNSLKNMIKSGADMNYQCKIRGWTPLMLAAQEGHIEALNLILQLKNIDVNKRNFQGNTCLMIACYNTRRSVIEKLINYADPSITNKEGTNCLMVSSALGDTDSMRILIEKGMDVNAVDNKGYSALMYCQIYGYKPKPNTINDYDGHSVTELELENRKMALNILISSGSRIDQVTKDDFDPLKLAIKHGPYDFLLYLLDRLLDINQLIQCDGSGWSPLKLSIRYSPLSIIQLILKKTHYIFVHQQYQDFRDPNSSGAKTTVLSILLQVIQFNRDLEIFIAIYNYFVKSNLFKPEKKLQIDTLLQQCRESNHQSIEDYLSQYILPQCDD
ncbi:ankyrin repeat-containing protein [Tieghemostelium lacteum]|uniref:Ankyrin repeat-containing protein n=1 Tax=Tieghemostelium lacteum TaxID=361077 RepID=A0A152A6F2_TIELA|nr:ankyrin repeat-containing protein [Tieghemostelium lacteum]|eukprot:KYR01637.1 ankyrin repeat-containing protein [Tieghemostelium lacteum]